MNSNVMWSLCFNGFDSNVQVLYYFGRPSYTFKYKEIKKEPKTIAERLSPSSVMLVSASDNVWVPIFIEVPTRPMPFIAEWIKSGKKDLVVSCHKSDSTLAERWSIKGANVIAKNRTIGRYVGIAVNNLLVRYLWAGRDPL